MSKVGDILDRKSSNEIWSVRSDQSVLDGVKMMADRGIGALLVIDDGALSGILSERDYARKIILEDRSSNSTAVNEIMTSNVYTVTRSETVTSCMSLMTENDFRHLPVVDDEKKVIGLISIGDLVKAIIKEQQDTISQLEQYITS